MWGVRRDMQATYLVLALGLVLSSSPTLAADMPALDTAVKGWAKVTDVPSYEYALIDLNDDSVLDAVVLISDMDYCGSGGCKMVVLRGKPGGFVVLSSSTVTREPVFVLPEVRYGWHTLLVSIAGGGVEAGQVVMPFNGSRYPLNPTEQPRAEEAAVESAKMLELQ